MIKSRTLYTTPVEKRVEAMPFGNGKVVQYEVSDDTTRE